MKLARSVLSLVSLFASVTLSNEPAPVVFNNQSFGQYDSLLVTDQQGKIIYQWQPNKALVPASLVKLLTTHFAIDKWGLDHRFKTDFYRIDDQLWVKGYGDPYLISEELDLVVDALKSRDLMGIKSLHIDASYFRREAVPGRSSVDDPYNAPLSAVAANFNTVSLKRERGKGDGNESRKLLSGEPQTPITHTAKKLAASQTIIFANKATRVNLLNADNAQQHFAEILRFKLGLPALTIQINQRLPKTAKLIHQHQNSHSLKTVLQGALKYSNNFIANQLFLKLVDNGEDGEVNFSSAVSHTADLINHEFAWQNSVVLDGAGLTQENHLSAKQIDQVLVTLQANAELLKKITLTSQPSAIVYAKTGTLNGVRNYAGFLSLPNVNQPSKPNNQYRFVFMFNRTVPYKYRDQLLETLAKQLLTIDGAGE